MLFTAEHWLKVWQNKLQLLDWKIGVVLCSEEVVKGISQVKAKACVQYEYFKHTATIYIQDDVPIEEHEDCVVHELLHIVLHRMTRYNADLSVSVAGTDEELAMLISNPYKDEEERAIHQITSALTCHKWV